MIYLANWPIKRKDPIRTGPYRAGFSIGDCYNDIRPTIFVNMNI